MRAALIVLAVLLVLGLGAGATRVYSADAEGYVLLPVALVAKLAAAIESQAAEIEQLKRDLAAAKRGCAREVRT